MNISEETFYKKYKPQVNHIDDNASYDGRMYETFGKELEYAHSMVKENRVWTIIEGDEDSLYIVAGFHLVNRQGFMVTEKPYKTGKEEVCLEEPVNEENIRKQWNKYLAKKNMKIGKVTADEDEEKFVVTVVNKETGKLIKKFESEYDLRDVDNSMGYYFSKLDNKK